MMVTVSIGFFQNITTVSSLKTGEGHIDFTPRLLPLKCWMCAEAGVLLASQTTYM